MCFRSPLATDRHLTLEYWQELSCVYKTCIISLYCVISVLSALNYFVQYDSVQD